MPAPKITNLSQFKRALSLGSRWETIFARPMPDGRRTVTRTVIRVQTNSVKLVSSAADSSSHTSSSSHSFGKVSDYLFNGDHVVAYDGNGNEYATYRPLRDL